MLYRTLITCLLLLGTCVPALSQSSHRALRRGDRAYKDGNYTEAEREYGAAIQDENSARGNYNLGNALYESGDYAEAAKRYEEAAGLADDPDVRSRAYRNLGDSYYRQQNYEQAVESYKESLRINPEDAETKYNLTKAIREVQQQQEQEQRENEQQDGEQQDQQQQQQGEGGENGNQQQQPGQQSQEGDESDEQQREPGTPGQSTANSDQPQMSREEAERQLGIAAEEEKRTLSRLRQVNREGCTGSKDW